MNSTARVIRAYLAQRATGERYSYVYRLDEIDNRAIEVRRNVHGARWFGWGEFNSPQSAAMALESLRMAAEREAARQGRVTG